MRWSSSEASRWPSSLRGACASTSSKSHCKGRPGVAVGGVWGPVTTDAVVNCIPLPTTAANRDGAGVEPLPSLEGTTPSSDKLAVLECG